MALQKFQIFRLLSSSARNVDAADVGRLASLADGWWDKNGPVKPLHALNHLRVPFVCDALVGKSKNGPAEMRDFNILEVGCGAGILTEALAKLNATVTAIDPAERLLDVARHHLGEQKSNLSIEYICTTVEEHAVEKEEHYDAIVASEVLEHVPDHRAFLEGCVRCLKPGGSLFLTTMNNTLIAWLGAIIIGEYVLNIIPKGTHDFGKFARPKDVSNMLDVLNCSTVSVRGFRYEFWRNVFVWQNCTDISYALHAVKRANKSQK